MRRRSATRPDADEHRRSDRGSALLLYPAGMLVLLALAAVAVDLTLVRTARQELLGMVQAAADDAAGAADPAALREGDHLAVDLPRARRIVMADLDAADLPGELRSVVVELGDEPGEVVVTASLEVRAVFTDALPGVTDRSVVTVTAVGRRLHL